MTLGKVRKSDAHIQVQLDKIKCYFIDCGSWYPGHLDSFFSSLLFGITDILATGVD